MVKETMRMPGFTYLTKALVGLAFAVALLFASNAFAACTSPAGNAGDIIYSSTSAVMVYCNGTNWINMGGGGGASVTFGTPFTTSNFCTATGTSSISCTTSAINLATQVTGSLAVGNLPALASANLWVGSGGGAAAAVAMSGDCSISSSGGITCTKTNGTTFGALATASTVALGTQVSGILPVANGGTGLSVGTSGGLPYFSSTSTIASSSALTANKPVIGGGAGAAPSVGTVTGSTTNFATSTGSLTSGDCAKWDSSGNIIDAGAACSTASGTVTSSTGGYVAYFPSTGTAVVGTSTMQILNGDVGIGTTSPTQKLDVAGNITLDTGGYIYGDTTTPYIQLSNAGGAVLGYGTSYAEVGGPFQFVTGGSEKVRFQNGSGWVGIGTAAPSSLLHTYEAAAKSAATTGVLHTVADTSSTASINKVGMDIESTGNWTGTSATNTGLVVNATGGTTNYAATFSGGNVGIGTTAPSSLLHVYSPGTYNAVRVDGGILASGTSGGFYTTTGKGIWWDNSASGITGRGATSDTTDYLAFSTNGAERVRIDSSGNVGIGSTSPVNALDIGTIQGIHIASGTPTNTAYALYNNAGTLTWNGLALATGGSMVYPGAGIPNSTGSAWGTSYTTTGSGTVVALAAGPTFTGTVTGAASTWSGTFTLNGVEALQFGTNYTTVGTAQNDVPIGTAGASVRYTGAGASTFNGIAGGLNGQVLRLHNGSSSVLTLANQASADTTVANQIVTGTGSNLSVAANSAVILQYDSTATNSSGATGAWRVIGGAGGGVPAGTTGQVQYNSGSNSFAAISNFTFLTATNALVVGTGATTPVGTTGTIAAVTHNVMPQAVTVTPVNVSGVNIGSATSGQMAYYSGSSTVSGTPNLYVYGTNIGIGTSTPTNLLSLSGQTAQTFWMEREYTAATAGNNLTITAGGATSGGSNLNGGNLILASGIATGTGSSNIQFQTVTAGTTGTTDRTASTAMTITGGGNVGVQTTTPIRPLTVVNEMSMTTGSGAYFNVSDSSGSNGGNMTLNFRGLGTNGTAGVNLSSITLSANNTNLSGNVSATGNIAGNYVTLNSGSNGNVALNQGSTGNPGYISYFNPSGTRVGVIGWQGNSNYLYMETENGYAGYQVSGNFIVNGTLTDSGETVNGALNISGTNALNFNTYGGGWYMSDTTWIRAVGNKNVYTPASIRADTQLQTNNLCDTGGGNCTSPATIASMGSRLSSCRMCVSQYICHAFDGYGNCPGGWYDAGWNCTGYSNGNSWQSSRITAVYPYASTGYDYAIQCQ